MSLQWNWRRSQIISFYREFHRSEMRSLPHMFCLASWRVLAKGNMLDLCCVLEHVMLCRCMLEDRRKHCQMLSHTWGDFESFFLLFLFLSFFLSWTRIAITWWGPHPFSTALLKRRSHRSHGTCELCIGTVAIFCRSFHSSLPHVQAVRTDNAVKIVTAFDGMP